MGLFNARCFKSRYFNDLKLANLNANEVSEQVQSSQVRATEEYNSSETSVSERRNGTKSFTLTFSAARRSRHKASALPEAATSSSAGVFSRTAQMVFGTVFSSCSPPRFAGGKPVVGLLYRAILILQNQLLPQVCFMQTCSGRNSFVAINLHVLRPRVFPQQNASRNNRQSR